MIVTCDISRSANALISMAFMTSMVLFSGLIQNKTPTEKNHTGKNPYYVWTSTWCSQATYQEGERKHTYYMYNDVQHIALHVHITCRLQLKNVNIHLIPTLSHIGVT